jgi:hypothetical protein
MVTRRISGLAFFSILGAFVMAPASGCSSSSHGGANETADDAGSSDDGGCSGLFCNTGDDGAPPPLECPAGSGLFCKKVACPNMGTTTLHGAVFDPAGKVPLFNVAVYVPNASPVTFTDGVSGSSCGGCSAWYTAPVVSTLTDTHGNFTLTDVPVEDNLPLIIQVGKWRRVFHMSTIKKCTDNDATALAGTQLRMPRNHTEGDIPKIAVSTGAADSLECLLNRMGIDKTEYTGDPMGAGRIHIFTGGDAPSGHGGAVTNAPKSVQSYQYLWNRDASMNAFDLVLLSCEGNETSYLNDAGRLVLQDYTNKGGRVFASHFHYSWFTPTGPFSTENLATWTVGQNDVGDTSTSQLADIITTLPGGMPFPEGASLKDWLGNVGALTNGKLPIYYSKHNADVTAANTNSHAWVALDPASAAPNATQYFSFDTPVASNESCGRVIYSDLHVSGGAGAEADPTVQPDYAAFAGTGSGGITPDGCAAHDLTAQEKALEFMIFDLSSCLTPVGQMTMPPPPK